MESTALSFTNGKVLATIIILYGLSTCMAGDSEDWSPKEVSTFAEEVLKSINEQREKSNTKPLLQLDPEVTPKGLSDIALMYAKLWRGFDFPPSMPLKPFDAQALQEKSGKTEAELEKLFKAGFLFYDVDPKHISGSTLINLAAKTEKKRMSTGVRDFANTGDHMYQDSTNCNALKKLLWIPATEVGVAAHWDPKTKRQVYVVLFDHGRAHHEKETNGKLTSEAIKLLESMKCDVDVVKPLSNNNRMGVIEKSINDLRKDAGLDPLKWTAGSGLMQLANAYAYDWAEKDKPASIPEHHILFTDADVYNAESWKRENLKVLYSQLTETQKRVYNDGMYIGLANKLLGKLIEADNKKALMPTGDSLSDAQISAWPRITQILCKDAKKFGYFATNYVFYSLINEVIGKPEGFNYYVLLFDKKCDSLPDLSGKAKMALLKKWNIQL